MAVNKVILIGNAGKDPEIRHLDSNVSVATFSLATSEVYTNKAGEKVTQTEWHNIVCWRNLATLAEKFIRKGSQLYVEGRIRSRTYDANDGTKKTAYEIYADEVRLLDRKPGNSAAPEVPAQEVKASVNEPKPESGFQESDNGPDDLPF
ncbi:MAG: single-stranded DNA-binding protein [Marinilabiliales bacterium]|nr:single-stranded DNA-binding protein [Marinilabiliales bacterium]